MASLESFWLAGWGAATEYHASASGTTTASGAVTTRRSVSTNQGIPYRSPSLLHGGLVKHASAHGVTVSLGAAAAHRDLTGRRRCEEQELLLLLAL